MSPVCDNIPEREPTIFSMTLTSLGVQKISEHPGQRPYAKICLAIKPDPSVYYFPSPRLSPWPYSTPTFFFLVALQEPAPNHPRLEGRPPQAAPSLLYCADRVRSRHTGHRCR